MCSLVALSLGCGARMLLHMEPKPLSPHAVFYEGGGGNSTALFHGREAFIVDAKLGDYALRLQRSIEEPEGGAVAREVKRVLLTHAHLDHTYGLRRFQNVGAVLVHPNCKRRLVADGDGWLRAQPYVEVEGAVTLMLGEERVEIFHPGVAHTDGDLAAYLPRQKLLIAGDLWNNGLEPEADFRFGGDLRGLLRAYDRLLELPFEEVLPGHGSRGTRAQVQQARDYLKAMEDAVRAAVAKGLDEEQTVNAVTLTEWPEYQPVPAYASRELNVRMMWRSLKAEAGAAQTAAIQAR